MLTDKENSQPELNENPADPGTVPDTQPGNIPESPKKDKTVLLSVSLLKKLGIIIIILFIIAAVAVLMVKPAKPEDKPAVVPTPTISTSIAPVENLHPQATGSAFLEMEQSISSLSATIGSFRTVDQTLNPPVLDLPLGF